jgi:potassium channel subfamily K
MPPTFLTGAFFAHIFRTNEPSDLPEGPDQGDPEKAGASSSGTSQDQAFDADRDDADQEIEDLDDFEDNQGGESADGTENEGRSGRGVPLTSTGTISSMSTFSRPSLPNWIVRIKDVLFVSHQDHEEFIPNYRRAVILSGSLVPFSILLEIPGLTEHWYIRTDGYKIVEWHKNPPWIIIALSFSLALAVIANIALLNRFLERRVKRCTLISIIALTIHGNLLPSHTFIQVDFAPSDILNIATVVIWAIQHRFNDGFTNGEAFWMTICSTIVSVITNVTLIWDLVTTPNFERAGMFPPV